jgi:ABC-type antimicrobial peptide transport system permease subunit
VESEVNRTMEDACFSGGYYAASSKNFLRLVAVFFALRKRRQAFSGDTAMRSSLLLGATLCVPFLAVCLQAQTPTGTLNGITRDSQESPYSVRVFRRFSIPCFIAALMQLLLSSQSEPPAVNILADMAADSASSSTV